MRVWDPKPITTTPKQAIRKLKFDDHVVMDARGFSGGIWVLWKSHIGSVRVVDRCSQIISIIIKDSNGVSWALSAVYASPTPSIRDSFWDLWDLGSLALHFELGLA